jgi:hypothetical protein
MRPPYLTCERHCRYYLHCKPTFDVWAAYREVNGRPCPMEANVVDPCPTFMAGERVDELPKVEVV